MNRKEIGKAQNEFWFKNFKKYTTEPDEKGFNFDFSKMMIDFTEDVVKNLNIGFVSNSLVADIRNKLTPPKNLCAMLKDSELMYHHDKDVHEIIEKEIENTLNSVEYLSNL